MNFRATDLLWNALGAREGFVEQTSKSAVSWVSKPADLAMSQTLPIWKSAIRQVGKPALRRLGGAVALLLLVATFAQAQDSQFLFDANGNLLVQSAATTAPPQIIGQPQNRVVEPGEATSFFVVAADTRALNDP